ncbi:MAG: oligosaccharide flippase family protein [Phormidesmis sp.]
MKKLLSVLDLSYLYSFLGEATLGLTLLFYILLARVLGPEAYEIFASAAALGAILSLFISLGFPDLLTREVALDPENGPKSTVHFLAVEAVGALVVLALLWPISRVLRIEGDSLVIFYFVMLAEMSRSVLLTLRGLLKGSGQFRREMKLVTVERCVVVACSVVVLWLTQSLFWVVLTFALSRFLYVLGFFRYLSRRFDLRSPLSVQRSVSAFKLAMPLALSGVLWIVFYQADILMIKAISAEGQAGFYSASYRIMEVFSALYRVIFYVSFTRFSRSFMEETQQLGAKAKGQMTRQIYKTTLLLTLGILPIVLIAGLFQVTLVTRLYGETFLPSVRSLAILLPSISIFIFGELARYVILAMKQDRYLPPLLGSAVVLNIIVNLLLIPQFGAVGAAIATLVSELALTLVCLQVLIKMGYQRVGWTVSAIALVGLFVTAVPSLMLSGNAPNGLWVLGIVGAGAIAVLITPQHFLKGLPQS